jgi:hypothetical protein
MWVRRTPSKRCREIIVPKFTSFDHFYWRCDRGERAVLGSVFTVRLPTGSDT